MTDLGLGHYTRPLRFRLRGIDCPELSTLADIRYLPDEPDPEVVRARRTYLNRQLLEEHRAVRYLR